MKRLLIAAFAALVGLGMVAQDAEAKRLGGGKSFGMQRDSSAMRRDAAPQAPAAPTQSVAPAQRPGAGAPAPAAPSGMSRWLGPVAGLAAGLGLAALASHLGLGEEFASILLIGLLVFGAVLLFRMLRRSGQQKAGMQYAGAGGGAPLRYEAVPAAPAATAAPTAPASGKLPADFDVEGFLRQAKLNFIRLQAANDTGNVEDLRDFTTPELFAELRLQIQERGAVRQQTDVVTLNAEVLDLSEQGEQYVVSVRFFGSIRETVDGQPEPFDEVWHLTKPRSGGSGWVIAGIQQFELSR